MDNCRAAGLAGTRFDIGSAGDVSHVAVEPDPDNVPTVVWSVADPGMQEVPYMAHGNFR